MSVSLCLCFLQIWVLGSGWFQNSLRWSIALGVKHKYVSPDLLDAFSRDPLKPKVLKPFGNISVHHLNSFPG